MDQQAAADIGGIDAFEAVQRDRPQIDARARRDVDADIQRVFGRHQHGRGGIDHGQGVAILAQGSQHGAARAEHRGSQRGFAGVQGEGAPSGGGAPRRPGSHGAG